MVKNALVLSEAKAKPIFKQILQGLAYLHDDLTLAHRDIKPENILMSNDDVPKITDFGFACWADDRDTIEKRNARSGTVAYVAPELFDKTIIIKDPRPGDIFSAGAMFEKLMENKLTRNAGDLLMMMKTASVKDRPTAKQCLEHAWFTEDDGGKTEL